MKILALLLIPLALSAEPAPKKGPNVIAVTVSLTGGLVLGTWLIEGHPWQPHRWFAKQAQAAKITKPLTPFDSQLEAEIKAWAKQRNLEVVTKDVRCSGNHFDAPKVQLIRQEMQVCIAGEIKSINIVPLLGYTVSN